MRTLALFLSLTLQLAASSKRPRNPMKLHLYVLLGLLAVCTTTSVHATADSGNPAAQYTLSKGNQRSRGFKGASSGAMSSHANRGGFATKGKSTTQNLSFSSLNDPKLANCDKSTSAKQTDISKPTAQPSSNGTTKVTLGKSPAAAMPLTSIPTEQVTPTPAADDISDIKQTAVTPSPPSSSSTKKTLGDTDVAGYAIVTPAPTPTESDTTDAAFDPKQSV
ncbi:hypothetical protein FI667_g5221, partial [Globisporangium splendens]